MFGNVVLAKKVNGFILRPLLPLRRRSVQLRMSHFRKCLQFLKYLQNKFCLLFVYEPLISLSFCTFHRLGFPDLPTCCHALYPINYKSLLTSSNYYEPFVFRSSSRRGASSSVFGSIQGQTYLSFKERATFCSSSSVPVKLDCGSALHLDMSFLLFFA